MKRRCAPWPPDSGSTSAVYQAAKPVLARASYRVFARLKRDGVIPPHCRFQVSLPTPIAPIGAFIAAEDQSAIEPIYERRLLDELATILSEIPHDQLAIQWDANFEFVMLEGRLPTWFDDVRAGVIERLLRLARSVPADVELGFHLCHSHEGRHTAGARDAAKLVEVANALSASLSRIINWFHVPAPADEIDPSYLAALSELSLRPETERFLGLLHPDHGFELTESRIAQARAQLQPLTSFGLATACGWGRFRPDQVPDLIAMHARFSARAEAKEQTTGAFAWPVGYERIPDEPWTTAPVDDFGLAYDNVEQHS